VDPVKQCSTCGSVTVDREEARTRLSGYLRREGGLGDEEAGRRADEIVRLIGGGMAFGIGATSALASNWWLVMLRGLLAILFGVFALAAPLAAFVAFVLVFAVCAFIDGVDALAMAAGGWRSWPLILLGLVGIAIGVLTFFRPGFTAVGLYAAIAAWSIARGLCEIALAIELRKVIQHEWWLIFAGVSSIVFGVLLVLLPAAGVVALAWLIGVYALIFGLFMFALSLRLRRVHGEVQRVHDRPSIVTPTPQPV